MKHNIDIENLIGKFKTKSISHEELAVLVEYFKENDPGNELLNLYQKAWDNAAFEMNETNASKIYSSVLSKINVETGTYEISEKPSRFLNKFLKYAAVFLIAFSISWFINNQFKNWKAENAGITYQKIEVPYGSKTKVDLPDGSHVTLNSGSKLKYAASFGNKSRTVYLEGEAFFDVKKNSDLPFYVNVSGLKIKVLGTSFNVKAYPEEKTIETTLISGKVQIYNAGFDNEKNLIATLMPSQKAVYEKKSGQIAKLEKEDYSASDKAQVPVKLIIIQNEVKVELTTAWKDNYLVFDNERFVDLTTRIERWYNVEIILNHPDLKNARFSGKFDKETIEQAMKALTFVTPFHYKIEKNKITITK